ncbi:Ubiquitin-fold modifier-conjugating enzyme 1 [Cryptosporidium felis]|nr:Ubiquitin-fold modifier-conjugating enzyme 1 [Cryptosporidium felis]
MKTTHLEGVEDEIGNKNEHRVELEEITSLQGPKYRNLNLAVLTTSVIALVAVPIDSKFKSILRMFLFMGTNRLFFIIAILLFIKFVERGCSNPNTKTFLTLHFASQLNYFGVSVFSISTRYFSEFQAVSIWIMTRMQFLLCTLFLVICLMEIISLIWTTLFTLRGPSLPIRVIYFSEGFSLNKFSVPILESASSFPLSEFLLEPIIWLLYIIKRPTSPINYCFPGKSPMNRYLIGDQVPPITINAGPSDNLWPERLKEELRALIGYVSLLKDSGEEWFKIKPYQNGTRWVPEGPGHVIHRNLRPLLQKPQIPEKYPITPFEIEIPELDGKSPKMYRGGKICLDIHFIPLWSRNCPKFGIVHALVSGLAPWLAAEVPILAAGNKI